MDAKCFETNRGPLWLTDEGDTVELDLRLYELPVVLDEAAALELRAWLDGWLRENEPPQQALAVDEPVERMPVEAGSPDRGEPIPELSDPDELELGPFARESEASRKAALEAYPKQGTQRWRILMVLTAGGQTRDELANALGLSPNTIRPRVRELIEGGWVEESERTRPSSAGQPAAVLELTQAARDRIAGRDLPGA